MLKAPLVSGMAALAAVQWRRMMINMPQPMPFLMRMFMIPKQLLDEQFKGGEDFINGLFVTHELIGCGILFPILSNLRLFFYLNSGRQWLV